MDGTGLTVYPGFIDAMSNWGFDPGLRRSETGAPEATDLAGDPLIATPPDHRKGLTPEFQVSSALRNEDQADEWRKAGFTAHLIAPDGGFIVGQSALVSLSNAAPRSTVLRAPVAQHMAFRLGGGNDYPRALMGVVAHCRQTLLDAGAYRRAWAAFDKAGHVGKRPPLDPALAELEPALVGGAMPVVFEADTRDSIHKALDFAAEFKLRPIIYGGREAWRVADRLKAEQVPVLLRVNFLEQPHSRLGRRASGPFYDAATSAENEKALPQRVQDDQQRQLKEEMANGAKLHRAGIPFAFSTQGQPGDKPWDKFRENVRKAIGEGLPAEAALRALTVDPARFLTASTQLGTIAKGKAAHLVVMNGDFQEADTKVRYVFADGVRFEYEAPLKPAKKPDEAKPQEAKKPTPDKPAKGEQASEIESDRKPKTHTGGNVLIRGATVLTVSNGTHPKTDILIERGKIIKIGENLDAPTGVAIIDAAGMFVMPGIVDTHCHFAISGGVNEFSLSVVPEVRVRDVIDGDDVQIYRALAGGVTTARLLHGSANVIGGQDAVIKLKYGEPANRLLLADAPRGVKFALGENVKRTDGRFPNTRLGVEAVLVRAFTEAQAYRKTWDEYESAVRSGKPVARAPPRPAPGSAGRHPEGRPARPLPLLPRRRNPHAPPRGRPLRLQDKVAPACPRGLQDRGRDCRPRRQLLDLQRLVGLQDRGLRRHPVQLRPAARGRRDGLPQVGQQRADAPSVPGGRQVREVRRHERNRRPEDDHSQRGEAAWPGKAHRQHRGRQGRGPGHLQRPSAEQLFALRNVAGGGRGVLPAVGAPGSNRRGERRTSEAPEPADLGETKCFR